MREINTHRQSKTNHSDASTGKRLPNPFGLYDLHGNAWEWCADFRPVPDQHEALEIDPTGPREGFRRVLNGGCWADSAFLLRLESVHTQKPDFTNFAFGIRVALSVDSVRETLAKADRPAADDEAAAQPVDPPPDRP